LYLFEFILVIYFTRPNARRLLAAMAGAVAGGLFALTAVAFCEARGWWRVTFASTPYFLPLLLLGLASLTPIYLITWRVARRFGWRGLALFAGIATIIGPPRDYLIAAAFPKWMAFAPGLAPIIADAATYLGIVIIGHAVMRLVGGPSRLDRLATGFTQAVHHLVGPKARLTR
jgi:hypothetical protein